MIKLKSLISKNRASLIVGSISEDGEVKSVPSEKTHGHLGFQFGKSWRYNPETNTVYWWQGASEKEKDIVEYHLAERYKYYDIDRHVFMKSIDRMNLGDFNKHWDDMHGGNND